MSSSKTVSIKAEPRVKAESSTRVRTEPSTRIKAEPSTRVKAESCTARPSIPRTSLPSIPRASLPTRAPAVPRASGGVAKKTAPRGGKTKAPRTTTKRTTAPRRLAPQPRYAAPSLTRYAAPRGSLATYAPRAALVYDDGFGDGTAFGERDDFQGMRGYAGRRRYGGHRDRGEFGRCAYDDDDDDDDDDDEMDDDMEDDDDGDDDDDDDDMDDDDDDDDGYDDEEHTTVDTKKSGRRISIKPTSKGQKKKKEIVAPPPQPPPPPPPPRQVALQELVDQGIDSDAAQRALDATCTPEMNNDPEQWAEAALIYHTQSLDNQQLITDMKEAMAVSLAEASAAAPPPPHEMPADALRARYTNSAVLHAVCVFVGQRVVRLQCTVASSSMPQVASVCTDVFGGPLRGPLLELLELEFKCKQWYPTTSTVAYFEKLARNLTANNAQQVLNNHLVNLQKLVFETTDGTVPVVFRETVEQGGDAVKTSIDTMVCSNGQVVECLVIE